MAIARIGEGPRCMQGHPDSTRGRDLAAAPMRSSGHCGILAPGLSTEAAIAGYPTEAVDSPQVPHGAEVGASQVRSCAPFIYADDEVRGHYPTASASTRCCCPAASSEEGGRTSIPRRPSLACPRAPRSIPEGAGVVSVPATPKQAGGRAGGSDDGYGRPPPRSSGLPVWWPLRVSSWK